ncbi:hypothetical protein AGLY_014313 [Aphis glycines]|uniref:Uncharacterized protein n=1 Tax=Aphis glycines TaxID=307491 RepID=A0A6G0T4H8_APHGL|nr:hypothetical protein AGLY_014313 [Aphis glycines]
MDQKINFICGHAIDTPVRITMIIANSNRISTIYSSIQMNDFTIFTFQFKRFSFTGVNSIIAIKVTGNKTVNKKNTSFTFALLNLAISFLTLKKKKKKKILNFNFSFKSTNIMNYYNTFEFSIKYLLRTTTTTTTKKKNACVAGQVAELEFTELIIYSFVTDLMLFRSSKKKLISEEIA